MFILIGISLLSNWYLWLAVGQSSLLKSSILVVGAGGLGAPALLYLAACGVGEMFALKKAQNTCSLETSCLNSFLDHYPSQCYLLGYQAWKYKFMSLHAKMLNLDFFTNLTQTKFKTEPMLGNGPFLAYLAFWCHWFMCVIFWCHWFIHFKWMGALKGALKSLSYIAIGPFCFETLTFHFKALSFGYSSQGA